jgi:peptidoglycan/xylan/chitin deacetylase (PgdA/CDA1 family)
VKNPPNRLSALAVAASSRGRRRVDSTRWKALDRVAGVRRRVRSGCVALTFDDGPHPGTTGRILDVLDGLDTPATFFCVGKNVEQAPELVSRMRTSGHAVGSHSYSHSLAKNESAAAVLADFRRGRSVLEGVLRRDVSLFRPPHGHLSYATIRAIRRLRLAPWLWSVDPEDWLPGRRSSEILAATAETLGGAVIVLHDWVEEPRTPVALDREATIAALPELIERLRRRGLTFCALTP